MVHKNGNKDFKSFKSNGTQYHTYDNKFHNWDGPAIIKENGDKQWFIYGIEYTKQQFENQVGEMKRRNDATSIPKNIY